MDYFWFSETNIHLKSLSPIFFKLKNLHVRTEAQNKYKQKQKTKKNKNHLEYHIDTT